MKLFLCDDFIFLCLALSRPFLSKLLLEIPDDKLPMHQQAPTPSLLLNGAANR